MNYLTAEHKTASASITHAGKRIPTAPLIARNDTARLADLGIYPHHRNTDPALLGTEWTLIDGEYHEVPLGTPEEREAATVNALRESLQAQRSAKRVEMQTAGFTHDGNQFASDREESIPLLLNAVIGAQMALAAGPEAVAAFESALGDGWRSTDGIGRVTTAAGILALHAAFVSHGAACDRHSQTIKAAIEAAETLADLDAIDLEAGWPG